MTPHQLLQKGLLTGFILCLPLLVANACSCASPDPNFLCRYYDGDADGEALIHVKTLPLLPYHRYYNGSGYDTFYFQPVVVLDILDGSELYTIGDTLNMPVGNTAACELELNDLARYDNWLFNTEKPDDSGRYYNNRNLITDTTRLIIPATWLCSRPYIGIDAGQLTEAP